MSNDKKKAQEAPQNAPESTRPTLMYVGPALKNPFPVATGAVFKNGLPGLLQKALAEDADLTALFVPLQEGGKALRQLEAGTGLINHAKAVAGKQAAKRN